MTHEFQVEGLHLVTRAAFACGGKLDVPQALSKREICAFGRILEQRSIGLLAYRINESCVALEFGKPEGAQPPQNRIHQIGDDVLRMAEFDGFQVAEAYSGSSPGPL